MTSLSLGPPNSSLNEEPCESNQSARSSASGCLAWLPPGNTRWCHNDLQASSCYRNIKQLCIGRSMGISHNHVNLPSNRGFFTWIDHESFLNGNCCRKICSSQPRSTAASEHPILSAKCPCRAVKFAVSRNSTQGQQLPHEGIEFHVKRVVFIRLRNSMIQTYPWNPAWSAQKGESDI